MLTVARTLMGNPRLILLDEPSEGVAPIIVDAMADMMLALKKTGVAIVLSEQNLPFAELVSDRAYVIEKGEMRFSGTMRDPQRQRGAAPCPSRSIGAIRSKRDAPPASRRECPSPQRRSWR